jgi:hypothetical protein
MNRLAGPGAPESLRRTRAVGFPQHPDEHRSAFGPDRSRDRPGL